MIFLDGMMALPTIDQIDRTLQIAGAKQICQVPAALGCVTSLKIRAGRVVAMTASGVPFIIGAVPKNDGAPYD